MKRKKRLQARCRRHKITFTTPTLSIERTVIVDLLEKFFGLNEAEGLALSRRCLQHHVNCRKEDSDRIVATPVFPHQPGDRKWIPSLSFSRGEEQQQGRRERSPQRPPGAKMTEWGHGANKSPSIFCGIFFAVPSWCRVSVAQKRGCRTLLGPCSGQQCLAG